MGKETLRVVFQIISNRRQYLFVRIASLEIVPDTYREDGRVDRELGRPFANLGVVSKI